MYASGSAMSCAGEADDGEQVLRVHEPRDVVEVLLAHQHEGAPLLRQDQGRPVLLVRLLRGTIPVLQRLLPGRDLALAALLRRNSRVNKRGSVAS